MIKISIYGDADAIIYFLDTFEKKHHIVYVSPPYLSLFRPHSYCVYIFIENDKNYYKTIDNIINYLYNEKKLEVGVNYEISNNWLPRD